MNPGGTGSLSRVRCLAPNLPGPVVSVSLTNMGGPMMGPRNGTVGGAMRMTADRNTVAHGTVSFLVTNAGTISHELVILPLPESQIPGTRPIGGDAKIDEAGSLGEASNTCAEGTGQGILPGASGWVTVTLPPGRYELVCATSPATLPPGCTPNSPSPSPFGSLHTATLTPREQTSMVTEGSVTKISCGPVTSPTLVGK